MPLGAVKRWTLRAGAAVAVVPGLSFLVELDGEVVARGRVL
jgi:hypothetical protein